MDKPTDGQDSLPTSISNPQTQGLKEASKAMVSQPWAEPQETDPQRDCVVGGKEMRTGQKEEILGHSDQISAAHFPTTTAHKYTHTLMLLMPKPEVVQKAPTWDFIPSLPQTCFNPLPL